ncbi:MAG: NUDIX domain-containing protein [Candidatus Aenigmarchaeota archaeon]|nr:NUDIX domain-containing protein [Candidatus Aenigmarchaeota archaeon]
MPIRKGVVGVVYRKGKNEPEFLLLHRQQGWKGWEFSKGGIESGEDDEEALVREIREETGIGKVKVRARMAAEISYKYPAWYKSGYTGTKQSVFLVEALEDSVSVSQEHDDYTWVDYRSALKMLKHKGQKKALSESFQALL